MFTLIKGRTVVTEKMGVRDILVLGHRQDFRANRSPGWVQCPNHPFLGKIVTPVR
jgi:hypothetical protein